MKRLIYIFLILGSTAFAQAPDWFSDPTPPRMVIGGDAGLFRISHWDFKDLYQDRWGPSYSVFAGVRVYSFYYAAFTYGSFEKEGKNDFSVINQNVTGHPHWQEKWYKIGVQIHPVINKKWGSFYGFGFAFYQINEKNPKLYSGDRGQGFYMDLGADYALHDMVSLYLKISISSGGESDRSGFESQSIGGYRFALGLSIWPF